jgi:hypothetical protein
LGIGRKKKHFNSKMGTGIGIELTEGVNYLIEDDIMRDVNPPFSNIKTFKTLV